MSEKYDGSGDPQGARRATKGAPERGRWTSTRKADAVLRLLRGGTLDTLSRELGVTAQTLSAWRDQFLQGGQANLKSRPADPRDHQIQRLKAKVGELTMDNEVLRLGIQKLESPRPFAPRRPRP